MPPLKERVWQWASTAADSSRRRAGVAMRPLRAAYDRRLDRIKAFLEDQGFNVPPNDCLPDPPGYKRNYFFPRDLPWHKHKEVWREAWRLYKLSWRRDVIDQHRGHPPSDEPKKSKEDEIREGLEEVQKALNIKTTPRKEGDVQEAFQELKDAVDDAAPDAKEAIKNVQLAAKERFEVYRETVRAFLAGYREVIEMHEEEERNAKEEQGPRARGEPAPGDPSVAPGGSARGLGAAASQHDGLREGGGSASERMVIKGAFSSTSEPEKPPSPPSDSGTSGASPSESSAAAPAR